VLWIEATGMGFALGKALIHPAYISAAERCIGLARAVAVVILAVLVVLPIAAAYAAKPGWVGAGKYAEYEIYVESSALNVSGRIGSVRIEFRSVGDINATVEVSASVDQRVVDSLRSMLGGAVSLPIPEAASYTYTWRYEDDLFPFLLGSRSLEELSRGRQVSLPLPPLASFSVSSESKRVAAGSFDCYRLSAAASLLGVSISASLWYEKSTGLLVAYEYNVQILGQGARVSVQLKSTNILGGPSIPLTTVVVVVVAITAAATGAVIMLRRSRGAAAVQPQQAQPSEPQAQPQ